MKLPRLFHFLLPVASILLAACSTTGSTSGTQQGGADSSAIPTGKWRSVYRLPIDGIKKLEGDFLFQLPPSGKGFTDATVVMELKPGQQFGTGKFRGLNRITWTERKYSGKVSREGNKLYVYSDPNSRAQVIRSTPPGYSSQDFWTVGGVNPDGVNAFDSTGPGVSIFEIVGKDLILTNSSDGNRWLYKWAGH